MGLDYALVHLTYTIPPAIILSVLFAPLCTRIDLYKIAFLIIIAVTSTIPWDRYLIRTNIWSYPPDAILGPKLFDIPVEEVFFFVIQTFNTSVLYLLLNKPILPSIYLVKEKSAGKWKWIKIAGQLATALAIRKGVQWIRDEGEFTYLGLILVWAMAFLSVLWSVSYQLLMRLPLTSTVLPIAIPTLYLWLVDTIALKRGTWVIEAGTKSGKYLWPGLEIEEAVFFLLTNMLVVFGLVAFDNALGVLYAFPAHFPSVPALPSPALLIRALLLPAAAYDEDRILGLKQSAERLRKKSRSFYLASGTFQGRLRNDLIVLYSFCRVADDLIDGAQSPAEAKIWVQKLKLFISLSYSGPTKNAKGDLTEAKDVNQGAATLFAVRNFPPETQLTLLLLPTSRMTRDPLDNLIKGFEMDLAFSKTSPTGPLKTEEDLDIYGERVAGTVASLCIQLVLHHHPGISESKAQSILAAGNDMGVALQYVNIARDLSVDARLGRCYAPALWLKKERLTPESFMNGLRKIAEKTATSDGDEFFMKKVEIIRGRLLDRASGFYEKSVNSIEQLPREARGPMRVAVESYMQIGRELRRPGFAVKAGRATVPNWRRIWVAWKALLGPSAGY
ncbi:Hypothetical protein R9X50_00379600 [Acrodontium crateriforme]|uniref:Bifunctional lycopene cyclase/phytoene synthase n=1 Tax=Acrodontium crateriforme TaxID=150365 RepID=A0AAQ3M9S5_9PEZI|nr:Hypothetical protein R9X50_00379600 [Acrodontium crateriforme]